jgi:hypothetical protein
MDCRGVILHEDRSARTRSDSLFCTPPPDNDAVNILLAADLRYIWPEKDGGVATGFVETEDNDPASQRITSSRKLDRATYTYPEPEHSRHLITSTRLQHLPQRVRERGRSPTAHDREQPAMALRGDSLTTLHLAPSASATTAGLHPTAKSSTLSCTSSTLSLPTKALSTPGHHNSRAPSENPSAVRLIDYSSGEEETKTHKGRVPIRYMAKTRAKQDAEKYKSAEFVESEGGGSDADTSDHPQESRKLLPQTLKRTTPPKAATTSTTPANMRMKDLSWGASSSSRKRPLPPTSYPAASKRPKQGPFVMESGSEDESVSDDDDSYNFDKHIAATPERPLRTGVAQDRPRLDPEQEVKALSTSLKTSTVRQDAARGFESQTTASKNLASQAGRLNKNRLITMMAKKHGGPGSLQPSSMTLKTVLSSTIDKDAGQSNAATKTPLLMLGAKTEMRNGPQHAARASSIRQDTSKSLPAQTASKASQAASTRHQVQAKSTGLSARPLQEQRRPTQEPRSSNRNGTQTHTQQTSSPPSALTTTRKADTARSQNAANGSSLRDLLVIQKTAHRKAAQEPDYIGSEWGKAQIDRAASVSLAKDAHRRRVGVRYGHTLDARKGNSQDRESRSPKAAATVDGISERAGSGTHAMSSAVTQFLVRADEFGGFRRRVQQQTKTSDSKDRLASDSAPTIKRKFTDNLRQPSLNSGLTSPSVYRIPPRLNFNKKTELVQGGPAPERTEEPFNYVVEGTRQRPVGSSPTSSSTMRVHEKVAPQDVISPTVETPVPEQKALSPTSKVASKHSTSPKTTQQKGHGHHVPDNAPNPIASEAHPSQQAVAEFNEVSAQTKSSSNAGGDNGLSTQTPLTLASTASSTQSESHAVQDFDKEVPCAGDTVHPLISDHVARAPDLYTSSVASTGPRMPVAVMICPEMSSGQSPRAQGTSEASSSPNPVDGTETSQTANMSRTSECQTPSPDKGPIGTDTERTADASLTRNRNEAFALSEAPTSMDLSPGGQEPVTQDQSAADRVEFAVYDAGLKHASERSSDVIEPTNPVDHSQNEAVLSLLSTSGISPPASTTRIDPAIPLLGTDSGQVPPELRTTIVPKSNPSKTLVSQPLAALSNANDAEKSSIEHPVPTAAVQSPTTSSTAKIALPSPTISPAAEPYFEYTIHQTVYLSWSSTATIELSAHPFTVPESANAQTDKLLQNSKQQYELLGMRCKLNTTKVLQNSLPVHEAVFSSIEDPSRSLTLKLWVERAEVSVYANRAPSSASASPLISKTLYALRLWRLADQADSDSEAEDPHENEQREKEEKEKVRIYHPLPYICTEVHTSLESANRAAKRVQIELSHEKAPKSLQAQWQVANLRELNNKLEDLCSEAEEGDDESGAPSLFEYEEGRRRGCWRSMFRGVGHNGFDFELLVTSVGVSGPRNI